MKIETDESRYEKIRQKGWHKTFAWLPVKIDDNHAVWLEFYERRLKGWYYDIYGRTILQWETRGIVKD